MMDAFFQIAHGIQKDMGILIERHQRWFFPNWSKLQKEIFDMVEYHLTADDEAEEGLIEQCSGCSWCASQPQAYFCMYCGRKLEVEEK